ncbi:hypothetical protein OY671_007212, partial [Metschnikowia pulcherrima]
PAEIAGIVARTRERGGIEGVPTGSHIFRHSLATNLLRAGAGSESVGTISRHSSPETTAIYAKFAEQERLSRLYAAFAEVVGDRYTKVERIYDWCHTSTSQYVAQTRFNTVRNFSSFAQAEDLKHEVPPAGVFGRGKRPRPTPTIIEAHQVRAIMTAALNSPPRGTISPFTYHYLFGLSAATGLRVSEASASQCTDSVEDGSIIRNGKFGKQRLIALQPSTRQALEAYLATRARLGATGNDLFVTIRGRAPHKVRAHVVPHTVKTYANCFVLSVKFAADRLKRRPTDLEIEDFGTDMIMAFSDHVENGRGSCVRTRNGRLAAIRSFFRYIEYRLPACSDQALRVRAIPTKKTDKVSIDYLDRAEIKALLNAPDPRTRLGTRDRAMSHSTYAGGLRVSESVSSQLRDFPDRSSSTVHIMGKGRRERVLPLWKETQFALRAWSAIRPQVQATEIFLNANGQPLTRDGFAFRLAEHVKTAMAKQPSIHRKRVTPHVSRHSCAMHTLAATGDIRKVASWLGHASIQSTETYSRADPEEKSQILEAHGAPAIKPGRCKAPSDALMLVSNEARNGCSPKS